MRLNRILSTAGVASRRAADELIAQGRVEVNGRVVTTLGTQADPDRDDIRVDGRRLRAAPDRRYLLMYKPRGVVSTRSDPQRRTTVIDLLAQAGVGGYFYPVGRLDYDSEGLILLTNDGGFAERVSHPRHDLEREYEVVVEGVPDERDLDRLRRGIVIDGRRTRPAEVRPLRVHHTRRGDQSVLSIVLREGRNRQVRHMCDAIAHPVARLRRVRIGPIEAARLKPGQIRDLTPAELAAISAGAGPRAAIGAGASPRAAKDAGTGSGAAGRGPRASRPRSAPTGRRRPRRSRT
ncbi:MAG: pseudouridine synthase [Vicinamibacterales bacterium]